jgi:hypothetical protein
LEVARNGGFAVLRFADARRSVNVAPAWLFLRLTA